MSTTQQKILAHYNTKSIEMRQKKFLGNKDDRVIALIAAPSGSAKPEKAFEIGYFYGLQKKKNIINISSQIGCPMKCQFCNVGMSPFSANLTPNQMTEQVWLALQSAQNDGIDMTSNSLQHKISVAETGEPLFNPNLIKALESIIRIPPILQLRPFSFKIATIFPINTSERFKKLADFAAQYSLGSMQMQISLISTSQEYRKMIAGVKALSSFEEIRGMAKYWQTNAPNARKINLSLILSKNTPCDAIQALKYFPQELFHFRFRECVETVNAKKHNLTTISPLNMAEIKTKFKDAGYDVDDHATPTKTEKNANFAANVFLEEYLSGLKSKK